MELNFQDEFKRSWLTSSLGLILFCGGVYLLTWNEGHAVQQHHSLEETFNNALILNPYEKKLKPEYHGRVVHLTGNLKVDEPLQEYEYGISIQAVKLKRRVQMYQWVEESSPRSDDDVVPQEPSNNRDYYYVTEWRDKLVDSSNFYIRYGHENPTSKPLDTVTYTAPKVRLGPFFLNQELKENFFNQFEEVTSGERPDRTDIKLHMGIYYHCQNIWSPNVGDIRVQFYFAGLTGEPLTIIAKQENNALVPYITTKNRKIALIRPGNLNINQMINAEHWDAKINAWKLRLFGSALIYFGIICWSKLLKILFSQIPVFSDIISGEAIDGRNFLVAASVSLLIAALAWILHRPVIGASLIFAAISPFIYCSIGVFGAPENGLIRN